jgi:hypothetical protein
MMKKRATCLHKTAQRRLPGSTGMIPLVLLILKILLLRLPTSTPWLPPSQIPPTWPDVAASALRNPHHRLHSSPWARFFVLGRDLPGYIQARANIDFMAIPPPAASLPQQHWLPLLFPAATTKV